MLNFLPGPVLFILNLLLVSINTLIFSIPILLFAIVRVILPLHALQIGIENFNNQVYKIWASINALIIALTCKINWRISGLENIHVKKNCILICNHLSWADIVILCQVMRKNLPIPKFFLKHSLIYIPIIGLVCLGLGMTFMRRYSREALLKNPKLKTKDLESTQKACRRLAMAPSTLVNFCEGTRFTLEKAKKANSPYLHLMPPKAASLGFALGQIGKNIEAIIDVTIAYPGTTQKPFINLLKGKVKEVYVNVRTIPIDEKVLGDYLNDKKFKHDFTMYLRDIWKRKDELLSKEVYLTYKEELEEPKSNQ